MIRSSWALPLSISAVLVSCERPIYKVVGGRNEERVIANAALVQVAKLSVERETYNPEEFPRLNADREVQWVRVDPGTAGRVGALIVGEANYLVLGEKVGRAAIPKLRLRFMSESETIDVFLCFNTSELFVFRTDELLGFGSFSPSHKRLVELLKKAFPGDPDVGQWNPPW